MTNDTGGPAFPAVVHIHGPMSDCMKVQGMTLRDYFAAKALPLAIENWNTFNRTSPEGDGLGNEFTSENIELMAMDAYAMADAMLAERDK